MNRLCIKK